MFDTIFAGEKGNKKQKKRKNKAAKAYLRICTRTKRIQHLISSILSHCNSSSPGPLSLLFSPRNLENRRMSEFSQIPPELFIIDFRALDRKDSRFFFLLFLFKSREILLYELTRPKKSKHWKIRTLNFIELLLPKVVHAVDVSLALALMLDLLRRLAAGAGLSLPFLGSHRWRLPPSLDNPNFKNKKSRLLLQIFVLCLSRAQRNPEFYLSDP